MINPLTKIHCGKDKPNQRTICGVIIDIPPKFQVANMIPFRILYEQTSKTSKLCSRCLHHIYGRYYIKYGYKGET